MFTVKQETGQRHAMWPNVSHVSAESANTSDAIDAVTCLLDGGGSIEFRGSPGKNLIYIMNDSGATVARYDLGHLKACAPTPIPRDPA